MSYLLGIDIGTSGTKVVAIDEAGKLVASAGAEYELSTPRPLWAEQRPEDWWEAVCACCRQITSVIPAEEITGIGLSGQMHGLVMLDKFGQVLRPAILWCDQRTSDQCEYITETVGLKTLVAETANPVLTGFTAPKIIWARDHEPDILDKTVMHLLPKDYIRFRLTGEFATEVSDASGTSLLNVPERRWSTVVLGKLGIPIENLPKVYESFEISGQITASAAENTGLKAGTPVVGGGGDQAAGAIGNGIVQSGIISVVTGTSGVVFAFADTPAVDPELRMHTFCHAVPGKWHVMGVMLAAGGALRWYRDTIALSEKSVAAYMDLDPYELITRQAATARPGSEGLIFLPYLSGERTPYPDPLARGAFIGLTLRHNKSHMARAVLEGVSYGLRDSLEILKNMGVAVGDVRASGGGSKSPIWRQIQADIFNTPLSTIAIDEGPALGAALLAGVGAKLYGSVEEACGAVVDVVSGANVNSEVVAAYEGYYQTYVTLYPKLAGAFQSLSRLV